MPDAAFVCLDQHIITDQLCQYLLVHQLQALLLKQNLQQTTALSASTLSRPE